MDKFHTQNCILNSATIGAASSAVVARFTTAFRGKANGVISDSVGAANFPALTTAKKADGTVAETLADGYSRVYTFLGTIDPVTGAVTTSVIAGEDFETRPPKTSDINYSNVEIEDSYVEGNKNTFIIGFMVIDTAGATFIPGTTALDAGTVTTAFINAFGWDGY